MTFKKTELLKDVPTTSDAFGTHRKIADLLRHEIANSNEGRSIALVGDWGSGKSTVIEILREDLNKNPEVPAHVFIYDAWSHQGDSLRRAFLDDFITSLQSLLTGKQRSDAVGRVWNRTEKTTTTREPILRRHAKIMLLSLALLPFGMELFQIPGNNDDICWSVLTRLHNIIAYAFMLAPVLCALFFGAVNLMKYDRLGRFFFGDSYNDPNFSVLSFFVEKVQGDVERKEIKSPVDSIGTFRDVFIQIVDNIHSRHKDLRIIIVIDNIDRIPAAQAREFWSTMQTFFSDSGGLRQPRSMTYWLIAPFSVDELSFIFGDGRVGAGVVQAGDLETNGLNSKTAPADAAKMRAKAYVDKTFGLAFYVPPPILKNWRQYLLTCLKEAFVEHDVSELEAVRDVYDFGHTGIGFITPRDIKLFVNSLVALYRQRGDDVPLTMMASYLLHREEIDGTEIRDELIKPRERHAVGVTNWRNMMAALHFGVPLDEGEQLLLYEPTVRALRDGLIEDLRELEGRPGFSDVLRKVILDELNTSQAKDGIALAQFATKIGALECSGKPEAALIWKDISRSLRSVRDWNGLQESPADGISVIIAHTTNNDRVELLKAVAASLSKSELSLEESASKNLGTYATNWTLTAKAVLDASSPAEDMEIEIPRNGTCALEIVKRLSELDVDSGVLSAFKVKTPVGDLSKVLAADIRAGNIMSSPDKFTNCVIGALELELQWPEIGVAIEERMQVADINASEAQSHLNLILSAYGYGVFPAAIGILKKLSLQGHLPHLFHQHRSNINVRAVIFAATALANPIFQQSTPTGHSQRGDVALNQLADAPVPDAGLVQAVAGVVDRAWAGDELFLVGATNQKVSRFVGAVIGEMAKSGYIFNIDPETVMEHWAYVESNADIIPIQIFLKSIINQGEFLTVVASKPFDIARTGFYCATVGIDSDLETGYWAFLEKGLSEVAKDDWETALTIEAGPHAKLLELATDLAKAKRNMRLQVPAKDAALAVIRKVVKGELTASEYILTKLAKLVGLLQDGYRASLGRDVTDDMMGLTDTEQMVRLVELMGDDVDLENENDPERIVRRVFSRLVSSPTERTVAWMIGIIEHKREFFKSLPVEAKDELKARLLVSHEEAKLSNEALAASLMNLANYFSFDLLMQNEEIAEPDMPEREHPTES